MLLNFGSPKYRSIFTPKFSIWTSSGWTTAGHEFRWTRPLDEALAIRQVRKRQVLEALAKMAFLGRFFHGKMSQKDGGTHVQTHKMLSSFCCFFKFFHKGSRIFCNCGGKITKEHHDDAMTPA